MLLNLKRKIVFCTWLILGLIPIPTWAAFTLSPAYFSEYGLMDVYNADDGAVYVLASVRKSSGTYYTDPDGIRSYHSELRLIKVVSGGAVVNIKLIDFAPYGDAPHSTGAIKIADSNIYVFANSKEQNGTYGMSGYLFSIDAESMALQNTKKLFSAANHGWFPVVDTAGRVSHFSYAGYYRYLDTEKLGSVLPNVMADEWIADHSAHSGGILLSSEVNNINGNSREDVINRIIERSAGFSELVYRILNGGADSKLGLVGFLPNQHCSSSASNFVKTAASDAKGDLDSKIYAIEELGKIKFNFNYSPSGGYVSVRSKFAIFQAESPSIPYDFSPAIELNTTGGIVDFVSVKQYDGKYNVLIRVVNINNPADYCDLAASGTVEIAKNGLVEPPIAPTIIAPVTIHSAGGTTHKFTFTVTLSTPLSAGQYVALNFDDQNGGWYGEAQPGGQVRMACSGTTCTLERELDQPGLRAVRAGVFGGSGQAVGAYSASTTCTLAQCIAATAQPAQVGNPALSGSGSQLMRGVDVATGNYHLSVADLSVPGKGERE